MYIVIGLGNTGKKYDYTRHNVGFDVIDYLSKKHSISVDRLKYKSLIGKGKISGEDVLLVKPQTFMNLSGQAFVEVLNFYKPENDKVIIIYDDIDTEIGKLRIRKKGSAGTHNGMKNIIYLSGRDDMYRLRVGVGKPPQGYDLANYVLGKFSKTEVDIISKVIINSGEAVEDWIKQDIDYAMNKYNTMLVEK